MLYMGFHRHLGYFINNNIFKYSAFGAIFKIYRPKKCEIPTHFLQKVWMHPPSLKTENGKKHTLHVVLKFCFPGNGRKLHQMISIFNLFGMD